MTSFPLYDNLEKGIYEIPLKKAEKDDLMSKIKLLDNNGHEIIYVLIKTHFIENEPETESYKMPYGMKSLKLGLRIDLNVIPPKLQQILKKFVELHNKNK